VIPIARVSLSADLADKLDDRTRQLKTEGADAARARAVWNSARPERAGVRGQLAAMAPGIERCMYCGDNRGTDIDHFEPISHGPIKTFEWLNHLLACSSCNSNEKRSEFPYDTAGNRLLVDPTAEIPSEHLTLILSSGEYRSDTVKGEATIRVFNLNRGDLMRGRQDAFRTRGAVLCYAQKLITDNREAEAWPLLAALVEEPHASVLQAMLAAMSADGAEEVLGSDVLVALADERVRELLELD
jgi:uncharacterized protein (TIGR02646 family)